MSDIRLKKITTEPSENLTIGNGIVNITNTTNSESSISGALVVNGGVSIKTTEPSFSTLSGGSLTVGGGIGVSKNIYIGTDYIQDTSTGLFRIKGLTSDRFRVDSVVTKSVTIAPDGVNNRFQLYDTHAIINNTTTSINSSIGGFVVGGGVSIICTENSTSQTSGGALTVGGGASVEKDLVVGSNISASNLNILSTISTSNLQLLNISTNNLMVNSNISTSTITAITGITSGTLNLTGGITTSNLFIKSNSIRFTGGNDSQNIISMESNQSIQIGENNTGKPNILITGNNFTEGGHVNVRYTTYFSADLVDGTNANIKFIINTSGNVGIGTSDPSYKLHVVGNAIVSNGISTSTLLASSIISSGNLAVTNISVGAGNIGDLRVINITTGTLNITNDVTASNLLVTGTTSIGNLYAINSTSVTSIITNASISSQFSSNITTGTMYINTLLSAIGTSNTLGNLFTNTGKVGIGTSNPDFTFDVIGSIRASRKIHTGSNSTTIDTLIGADTGGGIRMYHDNNDNTPWQIEKATGGNLWMNTYATGNYLVLQNNGTVSINVTTPHYASSFTLEVNGTTMVSGGVLLSDITNANGVGTGGSFTVRGGAAINKDVYIGGKVLMGQCTISSGNLYVISTTESLSLTEGSLLINGGITIKCTTESTSVTAGGGLTIAGGTGIVKNLYLGGNSYLYNSTNYYCPSSNIINLFDTLSIKRFSVDLDTSSKNFSISRYNSLGTFLQKSIDISNADGSITLNNTINSTAPNAGSLVVAGGISITTTEGATVLGNGGALTLGGGASVSKNVLIGQYTRIYSTEVSNDVNSGALVVTGGVGVGGNLNVFGNTVLNGNLTVNGITTSVVSTTITLKDNIVSLNSGPSGTKDAGHIIQRYQIDNDAGSGDVVNDPSYNSDTLPAQGGVTTSEIKLSASASAEDNYYVGWWIKIMTGFSANQVRKITGYIGSTRIATISSAWTSQNPTAGDTVNLYNKPYVGIIYNEIDDRFHMGSSLTNPVDSVTFTDEIPLYIKSLTCTSTQSSSNITTGSIVTYGGVSIFNTTDSSSITEGGTFTSFGGGSIGKTLRIGTGLYVNNVNMTPNTQDILSAVSFNASNNQSSPANITGLSFTSDIWGFDVYLTARLTATTNIYTNFHIRGVNKSSSWEIITTYVGDDSGITFNITSLGQLQYTCQNYAGFSSLVFKYRAVTI